MVVVMVTAPDVHHTVKGGSSTQNFALGKSTFLECAGKNLATASVMVTNTITSRQKAIANTLSTEGLKMQIEHQPFSSCPGFNSQLGQCFLALIQNGYLVTHKNSEQQACFLSGQIWQISRVFRPYKKLIKI